MRKIKLRAWDKDEKRMDYNVIIAGNRIIFDYELDENGNIRAVSYVDIEEYNEKYFEVMQYTGLKDKNGKDIYEGDIIKFSDKLHGYISFKEGKFIVVYIEKNLPKQTQDCDSYLNCYEVIGNMFENSNLVEV